MEHQNIRIRLKAFDHRVLDQSAGEIINTVTERNETIDHRIHDYINKYNENVTIHVQK